MKAATYLYRQTQWEKHPVSTLGTDEPATLVLCFGARKKLHSSGIYESLKTKFPGACIVLCSTAGEIIQDDVLESTIVTAALQFNHTPIAACSVNIKNYSNSYTAAIDLANQLPKEELAYVLVLSDGNLVNGSELVKGLSARLPKNTLITGGLAGDGSSFMSTLVGLDASPQEGEMIAIGFYGTRLKVTHGSKGGWDMFGLEKTITNASGNILAELENENALELYKKYLGQEAANLPAAALLFPLSVTIPGADKPVVRTILSINERDKSMTFAGDVPVGSKVRFMKADMDRLTSAAADAATQTAVNGDRPGFSLLISCVGRKLIMGPKITEEVKAVSRVFDNQTVLAGFYSYGEISPFNEGGNCQLHNQTITITSFYEN